VTGFWATFVGVVGSLAALVAAFQGIKIVMRGRRTTFTANIWKRLAEVEAALEREKTGAGADHVHRRWTKRERRGRRKRLPSVRLCCSSGSGTAFGWSCGMTATSSVSQPE
jgi:hypothetical protein